MPCLLRLPTAAGIVLAASLTCGAAPALAQNDWQFPDPYFGILEIEKSHDAATTRRYRSEVAPAPRGPRPAPSAWWQPAPANAAAAPAAKTRWRNRWRR